MIAGQRDANLMGAFFRRFNLPRHFGVTRAPALVRYGTLGKKSTKEILVQEMPIVIGSMDANSLAEVSNIP